MRKKWILFLAVPILLPQAAAAHHLDEFDERIRKEANLPAEWFTCKLAKDCDLVSVPCQSDLAVNIAHSAQAREALIQKFPFCLGSDQHDTEVACEKRQCVTKAKSQK